MAIRQLAAAIVLACTLAACGGITDPSTNQVVPFSGTFDVGGSGTIHSFSASKNGEFFVTLTSLTPDTTAIVGVTLGQGSGSNCVAITNTVTTVGRQAFNGPLNKGDYCIQVGDSGLVVLSGPQSYTIRVSFP
jgi:hypothetical protein